MDTIDVYKLKIQDKEDNINMLSELRNGQLFFKMDRNIARGCEEKKIQDTS